MFFRKTEEEMEIKRKNSLRRRLGSEGYDQIDQIPTTDLIEVDI